MSISSIVELPLIDAALTRNIIGVIIGFSLIINGDTDL